MDVVGSKANGVGGWLRHRNCDRSACRDVRTGRKTVDAIVLQTAKGAVIVVKLYREEEKPRPFYMPLYSLKQHFNLAEP